MKKGLALVLTLAMVICLLSGCGAGAETGQDASVAIVACSILYAKYGGAGIIDVDRFNAGYSEKQLAALETWNSNLGDGEYTAPGAIQYSTEEAEAYAALFADISTYATQCSLSFLTGDMSLEDDWDTYLANLEQLGLSDWLEVCQSAYDRYSERVAEAVSE